MDTIWHIQEDFKAFPKNGQPQCALAVIEALKDNPPFWIRSLIRLRDKLVKPFGLKTADTDQASSDLGPIKLKVVSDEIVELHFDDWHLRYLGVIYVDMEKVTIQNRVHFKNLAGRLYFYGIWPGHWAIYRALVHQIERHRWKPAHSR